MVLGDNPITTNSSAITLTCALLFWGRLNSSASALLFFGQLPTSVHIYAQKIIS